MQFLSQFVTFRCVPFFLSLSLFLAATTAHNIWYHLDYNLTATLSLLFIVVVVFVVVERKENHKTKYKKRAHKPEQHHRLSSCCCTNILFVGSFSFTTTHTYTQSHTHKQHNFVSCERKPCVYNVCKQKKNSRRCIGVCISYKK